MTLCGCRYLGDVVKALEKLEAKESTKMRRSTVSSVRGVGVNVFAPAVTTPQIMFQIL